MIAAVSLSDLIGQLSLGLDAVEGTLLGAEPCHGKRVAVLCTAMGRYLGYGPERLFTLACCALLHDNALTEYILSEQPGVGQILSLKTHCVLGERNCKAFPFPASAEGLILYHHEHPDGGGPFGFHEEEIPEGAGLIALADRIDVKWKLHLAVPGKLEEVRATISQLAGLRFTHVAAGAALAVLDDALLTSMGSDVISATLEAALPEMARDLTDGELMRISTLTAKIIDYKSRFTQIHTTQIANKAWHMAGVYGYGDTQRAQLYQAAALHDIGKLFIPTQILEKPGKLSGGEYRIIQSHVQYTWDLLSKVRGFGQIAIWAADHHEKLDGTGYPFGKKGTELDTNSRLLACLDIYQAVREERPYHPARSHRDTLDILTRMANNGFVDGDICADLDRHLADLEGGIAPTPTAAL